MKVSVDIPEDFIRETLKSAIHDFVYDHARRFVDLAIERELSWSQSLRFELYDELNQHIAAKLGVTPHNNKE
jgi:hypothetical protein